MKNKSKPDQEPSEAAVEHEHSDMLTGLRVLIVEDVGMVAMALKSFLEELGCVVVGTKARLHETEEFVRNEILDGVLLDLNLGGQYSYPVADILRERKVPFIIMSGYDAGQLRPDLSSVPQMQKPFEREGLEAMILAAFCAPKKACEMASSVGAREPVHRVVDIRKTHRKTQEETEAAVCLGMCRFEQEYIGRAPKEVDAHLFRDLLVVRLQGVLTIAEQQLVANCSDEQGRDLIKKVRKLLIETARPQIESMIQVLTGVKVLSMHHDISTVTGEEVVIFSLSEALFCRDVKVR
jgi:uncharacterized protein YbcI